MTQIQHKKSFSALYNEHNDRQLTYRTPISANGYSISSSEEDKNLI